MNVGEIGELNIGSANNTSSGHIQLQLQLGGSIQVNGATSLGVGTNQASINLNNGAATLNLRGDVNNGGTATNHFIQMTSNNADARLILGADVNGFEAIDLRINRTGAVIYDTTGDGVTDTGAQTFNLDNFDVVANTATNGLSVTHTVGVGKTFNVDDIDIARNNTTSSSANTIEGTLNINGSTWTVDNNIRVGTTTSNSNADADARTGTGTINIGQAGRHSRRNGNRQHRRNSEY